MFYQIFLSLQVKGWAIITYKHLIHEYPHQLRNYLTLRGLWAAGASKPGVNFRCLYPKKKNS